MAQQPVKFKYRIIYCSSEDPQHPATELLDPTVNSKGWVSARYCEYPQVVILQFS